MCMLGMPAVAQLLHLGPQGRYLGRQGACNFFQPALCGLQLPLLVYVPGWVSGCWSARWLAVLTVQVDPFDKNSPIKQAAIEKFPPDMFFVLRVVQLLRGMANGEWGQLCCLRLKCPVALSWPPC